MVLTIVGVVINGVHGRRVKSGVFIVGRDAHEHLVDEKEGRKACDTNCEGSF